MITVGCHKGVVWFLCRLTSDGEKDVREYLAVSPDPRAIEAAARLLCH